MNLSKFVLPLFLLTFLAISSYAFDEGINQDIRFFSTLSDRSSGTPGAQETADYIAEVFKKSGLHRVGFMDFDLPVPDVEEAFLEVSFRKFPIHLLAPNLVVLSSTPPQGIEARIVYAGKGEWSAIKDKDLKDSVIVCETDSPEFWFHAASLGAKALIYLGNKRDGSLVYSRLLTKTPVSFPRFWMAPEDAEELKKMLKAEGEIRGRVVASSRWKRKVLRNVYGFIAGSDEKLRKELVVIEAPYDATRFILKNAPGMDEATSVIALLSIARHLARNPPKRSVLFVATAGKNESFAGARTLAWELTASDKDRQKEISGLRKALKSTSLHIEAINRVISSERIKDEDDSLVYPLVIKKAKDLIDDFVVFGEDSDSDELPIDKEPSRICLSLGQRECSRRFQENKLLILRSIAAKSSFKALSNREFRLARKLMKEIRSDLKMLREEITLRLSNLESNEKLGKIVENHEIVMILSINISSQSPFLSIKQQGTLFPLREDILKRNRISSFLSLAQTVISKAPASTPNLLFTSFEAESEKGAHYRPSYMAAYPLSSDPLSIAGLPAVSIVSDGEVSPFWGTPLDTINNWNAVNAFMINDFLGLFIPQIVNDRNLRGSVKNGVKGLATLEGSTMFIRKGELFPDRPASGTILSVIQGDSLFTAMSYRDGSFSIPGVASKRVSYHKLIIEPYGLAKDFSTVTWAANKRVLRKENYRVQISGKRGFTTLIMFPCVKTDVVDVFKPQSLSQLTRVTVLDAVTETMPSAFWFSRMDGRDTFSVSVFLEKQRRFKLLLSDSLITKDVLFLNSDGEKPEGYGFVAGRESVGSFRSALDMSQLVKARLDHLKRHGVVDQSLEELYRRGSTLIEQAKEALAEYDYGRFWEFFSKGWAELSGAYRLLDRTQRDVLAGVMFFIVLLVPFSYCLERFLFCFVSVYHQIATFIGLLIISVAIVGWIHPAFALTYSPPMVIIAFLIMGLAVMVIWIIFTRFEQEISTVRRSLASRRDDRSAITSSIGQMKLGQAMIIALDIGASNLHRRPLRTVLTCATIVILTFTIMSFTSLKTIERPSHNGTAQEALYSGILVHNPLWFSLSDEAWRTIRTVFEGSGGTLIPRSWLDPERTDTVILRRGFDRRVFIEGVLGIGSQVPPSLVRTVIKGRWLSEEGYDEILIPSSVAKDLGISFETDDLPTVRFHGRDFVVVGIFDEEKLARWKDLNGETILPLFFERGAREELREAEVELMESGLALVNIASRLRSSTPSKTVIVHHKTCLDMGGELKAIGVMFEELDPVQFAERIPFSVGLSFFAGREGSEAYEVKLMSSFQYQGLTDVVIPVMIVIAICFNTLIGHVQERRREIAVYTSIGLAPRHVGMLFVVEALSLAVLSSVFGYIIAQIIATFGKGLPLFVDVSLNYSSLASVMSLMLIFATVFLASIYPALMATRIAMPDVEKGWSLPRPKGDVISVDLPFLFRIEEHHAVMKFLQDFIEEHREATVGDFIVDDVELTTADETELDLASDSKFVPIGRCFLIQTSVWLAPFDFGIQQRVRIFCCPSEVGKELDSEQDTQYVQIHLHIERLLGEVNSWYRANRYFVKKIRKAILRWHTLKPEEKTFYGF